VEIVKAEDADAYEIKIKCALDTHGKEAATEFLEQRNLKMREEKGFIIIHQ